MSKKTEYTKEEFTAAGDYAKSVSEGVKHLKAEKRKWSKHIRRYNLINWINYNWFKVVISICAIIFVIKY